MKRIDVSKLVWGKIMLEIGTEAPAFALPDQNGEMKSLSDEKGIIIKAFDKVKAADNPAQMSGEL